MFSVYRIVPNKILLIFFVIILTSVYSANSYSKVVTASSVNPVKEQNSPRIHRAREGVPSLWFPEM